MMDAIQEYIDDSAKVMKEAAEAIKFLVDNQQRAVQLAIDYGGTDGAHHKTWVIDQMVRILTGNTYDKVIADAKNGDEGPDTYGWDTGIAP